MEYEDVSRQEHLECSKQRAYEYLESGDVSNAMNSFVSDMRKHSKTANHSALPLMLQLYMGGHLNTPTEMKKFIDGFN